MRILYISLEWYLSIHAFEMMNALVAEGVEVTLLHLHGANGLENLDNRVKRVDVRGRPDRWRRFLMVFQIMRQLHKHMRSGQGIVYVRQNVYDFWLPLLARVGGYQYWAELNHCAAMASSDRHPLRRMLVGSMEKLTLSCASRIVVPSQALAAVLLGTYRSLAMRFPGKICVIPNAANTQLFVPLNAQKVRKQLDLQNDIPLIGFVGSLMPWQGVETFVQSMTPLANLGSKARFLVVGGYDVYAESETRRRVEACRESSQVHFSGRVSYSESALWMAACDILVAPSTRACSRYGGGSPMKVYAYLACGRPVVLSALDGWTEYEWIVSEGVGIAVPPEQPKALAEALHVLLLDAEKTKSMGQHARQLAEQLHDWRHRARTLLMAMEKH